MAPRRLQLARLQEALLVALLIGCCAPLCAAGTPNLMVPAYFSSNLCSRKGLSGPWATMVRFARGCPCASMTLRPPVRASLQQVYIMSNIKSKSLRYIEAHRSACLHLGNREHSVATCHQSFKRTVPGRQRHFVAALCFLAICPITPPPRTPSGIFCDAKFPSTYSVLEPRGLWAL